MNLLETKSLSVGYTPSEGKSKVLQRDISVTIKSGEIISLMGQNGVGKTTFVKTISGLIPRLGGSVYYQNQELADIHPGDLAKKLSVVLTEKPYTQNLSVIELIAIGRHPYSSWLGTLSKKDLEAIDWAISETNINYLANHKVYELSDGQLQKVMIARALAQETDMIILDEPAAHLDLYNKIEVMMLLRDIAKKGKGILISTHDMQISTQLSDKLWLFNFNEPVTAGTPEDLILNGTLEKTLYLQDYGYDMIHGTVKSTAKTQKTVNLVGPEKEKYWTERALSRNDFAVNAKSETIITIKGKTWTVQHKKDEIDCNSIKELLDSLKYLYQTLH